MDHAKLKPGDAEKRLARWLGLLGWMWWGMHAAQAHDYWLEPEGLPANKGDEILLHLRMGERFKTEEERPLQKDRIARFDLYSDRARKRDLLAAGQEGQMPVAKVRLESGACLAVMDRTARPLSMDHDKFNRYLSDEGLDAVIGQRARAGQTEQNSNEIYTRYLKALMAEGDHRTPNTLYKRRVGEKLEILLENDPDRLGADRKLGVKVLFEGRPLVGARVFAYRRGADDQPRQVLTATTSAQGLASFKLDQAGVWLVRLVHMQPAAAVRGSAAGQTAWESFWAAYTFAAREAPMATPTPPAGKE